MLGLNAETFFAIGAYELSYISVLKVITDLNTQNSVSGNENSRLSMFVPNARHITIGDNEAIGGQ